MRVLSVLALIGFLTACGCEGGPSVETTKPAVIEPAPAPEPVTPDVDLPKFVEGDSVILTLPDGETIPGTIVKVGELAMFGMPDGSARESRMYVMRGVIETTGPGGEEIVMVVEGPVPEFALTRKGN